MNNKEIDSRVRILVGAYLKDNKIRKEDEPVIQAGMELVINILQNLNDIAWYSHAGDRR